MNLLFPVLAEIRVIDHTATAANAGHAPGRRIAFTNANDGTKPRRATEDNEKVVRALAQFESGSYRNLTWTPSGDTPRAYAGLLFDKDDLEPRGLINPHTQLPIFGNGDRLVAVYDAETEDILVRLDEPGIKIVEMTFLDKLPGFSSMYLAQFEDRPKGGTG